jgi:cytochrome c-type biogenesis protein CcmF
MAFAPQISWGKHEKKDKQLPYILIFSLVISLLSFYLFENFYFALSVFITGPLFIKSILVLNTNVRKNLNFYSQWLAHLSIGVFIIAAVYTEQFDYEENLLFEKNSSNEIALQNNNIAIIKNIKDESFQNYQRISVDLLISDGQQNRQLSPSKNIYQPSGQVTNEVNTTNVLFSQYYATISTIESDQVGINLVYKPFINLLWLSSIMLIFSIFLSIVKRK